MSNSNVASVQLAGVYKSFGEGQEPVLRGIDIAFPQGKLTYLLGPSGAGKSILLKHILGLVRPDAGEVWIEGEEISHLRGRDLAKLRYKFGMLFQNSALFDDMSVFDNIAFPLREHTSLSEEVISKKIKDTLALLGMKTGWHKYPNELSGGMRKRVALARAIIREPSILLYDEPTTGLDPVTRTTVDELIETLKRELKLTSIVISHDIPSAILLADIIAFLSDGKIVFFGTPAEFKHAQHPAIQSFLEAEKRSARAFQDVLSH